jgi:hypothetical protein
MTHCTCPDGSANADNPTRDLAIDITFLSELAATIAFRLHQRSIAVFAASLTSGIFGYVPLKMAGIDPALIIGILLGTDMLAVWALISSQTIFRRSASPSYALVALRSVQPNRRYEFLATLNTVSLRGQRIPFTQWDVLAAVRECSARRVEKEAVEHARTRQAAMLQASLIDAFRGG